MVSNDSVAWCIFRIVMAAAVILLAAFCTLTALNGVEQRMMRALLQESCQKADVDQAKLFSLVDVVLIEKRISQKDGKFYIKLGNNREVVEIQVPEEVFNNLKIGKEKRGIN